MPASSVCACWLIGGNVKTAVAIFHTRMTKAVHLVEVEGGDDKGGPGSELHSLSFQCTYQITSSAETLKAKLESRLEEAGLCSISQC